MHILGELGVLVLLFRIGLETDTDRLRRVGGTTLAVGITGVALPFAGGVAVALAMGLPTLTALVIGAALTATSIGISARVLGDVGRLNTSDGQVVLGAAVFDDAIGLIILAVVGGIVAGGTVSAGGIARTTLVAAGFVAGVLVLGLGLAITAVAVLGKIAAGWAPWWYDGRKLLVGMVPRGEVGLIFAPLGATPCRDGNFHETGARRSALSAGPP